MAPTAVLAAGSAFKTVHHAGEGPSGRRPRRPSDQLTGAANEVA